MSNKPSRANEPEKISGLSSLTQLLALNTMLEAARAGKEARGFASVAGEIRDITRKTNRTDIREKLTGHDNIGLDQDGLDMAVHDQLSAMEELNNSLLIKGRADGSFTNSRHMTTRELNHMYQLLCQDQGKDSA